MKIAFLAAFALLVAAPLLAQEQTHVVRPGDTLARLMWTYGVSGDAIRRANHLSSTELPVGRRIVIPAPEVEAARRAEPVATPVPLARVEPAIAIAETPPVEAPKPTPREEPAPRQNGNFADAIAIPAAQSVRYNGHWVPPGESSAWVMDCSNTTRWLYREVRGLDLPRTASDQYEWLRARHRLWRIGPDAGRLRRRLQPGDLLFWENTYRPVRRPPVTHVMLYLGLSPDGRMMMAGSQGASGPDTYEFVPAKKMGGYRFFFFFRRDGRFVAYGRP